MDDTTTALYGALKAYEKWEADLLADGDAWRGPLPAFTQPLYDTWMVLQARRNTAIKLADENAAEDRDFEPARMFSEGRNE